MDFAKQYEICAPGVIAENFDGDVVILNLEDGRYFSLRGAGPSVWNALMAGATPQSLLACAERDCPALAESTRKFFCDLAEMQLIRHATAPSSSASAPAIEWHTFSEADKPQIDVFDDLSELIMADPIHDVDAEAGWPIRKAA